MYNIKFGLVRLIFTAVFMEGTYAGTGQLQTQIESGLEADVCISAAPMQMHAPVNQSLLVKASVKPLLTNTIVLITPAGTVTPVAGFEHADQAGVVAASGHQKEAQLLIDFLASEEGLAIFQKYGFGGAR